MKRTQSSRRRSDAIQSSRLQMTHMDRFSADPGLRPKRSAMLTNIFKSENELSQQRLSEGRHPQTGLGARIPGLQPRLLSQLEQMLLQQSPQRLSANVLESWINSTLSDAEHLDIPGLILKPNHRLPLSRYGVDRSSLLNIGLQPADIDKIYRSLFVYSIGFYQMIMNALEHSGNKYVVVAALWKVFAILLEYCCHLDYQMIITAVNIEKQEELEAMEKDFRDQLDLLAENEKKMIENLAQAKKQMQQLQGELQREIGKRQELEDEILQRGTGHEEEVSMRLGFESKLNIMFAKQRDMEIKAENLHKTVAEQQKLIDKRNDEIAAEKRRNIELSQIRVELEQEIKRLNEKISQIENVHEAYEERLNKSYAMIETQNSQLSTLHTQFNQALNELAQKKVEADDLKCELEIYRSQQSKQEEVISTLKNERESYIQRASEVDKHFYTEIDKYKHYEQEYARLVESDSAKALLVAQFKEQAEKAQRKVKELEKERDALKVHLETSIEIGEEYKVQAKLSQERIEEMNRGRRIVEEQNMNLESKLNERNEDLKDLKQQFVDLRREHERFKTREVELEGEISVLQIKIESNQKQFETNKETLQEKIENLNGIITSEKKIRENWIFRYEEEQKVHNSTIKELTIVQDKFNDAQIQINTLKATLEEHKLQVDRLNNKNKTQTEELLEIRSVHEEVMRKNKTFEMLLEAIDKEHQEKVNELNAEIDLLKENSQMKINSLELYIEETWERARINLEKFKIKANEHRKLTLLYNDTAKDLRETKQTLFALRQEFELKSINLEDFRNAMTTAENEIATQKRELSSLKSQFDLLQFRYDRFMNMIPEYLKEEPNPFKTLEDKILALKEKIDYFESMKRSMLNQETQIFVPTTEQEMQTDVIEHSKQSVSSLQSSKGIIGGDFPLRQKLSQSEIEELSKKAPSRDSLHREDIVTPVNLKSVYGESAKIFQDRLSSKGKDSSLERLPDLPKRKPPVPKTAPGPPADVKRFLKQAQSRRKADSEFT